MVISLRLEQLPPELLDKVVSEISAPRHIASLAQTGSSLNKYTKQYGWREFVRKRFSAFDHGSIRADRLQEGYQDARLDDETWQTIAHSITSQQKAWDRRAFQATTELPSNGLWQLQTDSGEQQSRSHQPPKLSGAGISASETCSRLDTLQLGIEHAVRKPGLVKHEWQAKWRFPAGQSTGFTPCIDCYETQIGSRWVHKKRVLAYSAGAELLLRVQRTGDTSSDQYFTYRPPKAVEGRDDITGIELRHGQHKTERTESFEDVIISTVAGSLQRLRMRTSDYKKPYNAVNNEYDTAKRPVRAISLNESKSNSSSHLTAVLGNDVIALYQVDRGDSTEADPASTTVTAPLDELAVHKATSASTSRVWNTTFIGENTFALSQGPVVDAIRVHTILPTGIDTQPLASILFDQEAIDAGRVDVAKAGPKTIYPIVPLNTETDKLFVSGGYDGVVRIHDIRSSAPASLALADATSQSAVYSLLTRPNHRVFAGTAQHGVVKVFDLRHQPGLSSAAGLSSWTRTSYSYTTSTPVAQGTDSHLGDAIAQTSTAEGNFNIFATGDPQHSVWDYNQRRRPRRGTRPRPVARPMTDGPVYSLTSPSPYSPDVYVGLENTVRRLCFSSCLDRTPDPCLVASGDLVGLGRDDKDVLRLAMFDNDVEGERGMDLVHQCKPSEAKTRGKFSRGLDERWMCTAGGSGR